MLQPDSQEWIYEHPAGFKDPCCSRIVCIECQTIFQHIYEWENSDLNTIHTIEYGVAEIRASARQCPTCELFLTDFDSRGFDKEDLKRWDDQRLTASPIRAPYAFMEIRLEVWDEKERIIKAVPSIHLFDAGTVFFLAQPPHSFFVSSDWNRRSRFVRLRGT